MSFKHTITKLTLLVSLLVGSTSLVFTQDNDEPVGIEPSAQSQTLYAAFQRIPSFTLSCENLRSTRMSLSLLGRMTNMPENILIESIETDTNIRAKWFVPDNAEDEGILMYLHGGAYVAGSLDDAYQSLIARLADVTQMRILAVDYRLAPEHPYPAALDDSLAAYRWIIDSGIAADTIIIAGDSAGGGLSLATLLALRDAGDALPAAAVLLSPWVDLTLRGVSHDTLAEADPMLDRAGLASTAACYVGTAHAMDDPYISPLFGDLEGLPPMMIQVGSYEILLSDSTRLAQRARRADVDVRLDVWDGQMHVWPLINHSMPESRQVLQDIASFVRQVMP